MISRDAADSFAETLARSVDVALVEKAGLDATIRPIDYMSGEIPSSIPETRACDLPSVTLSEPTLVDQTKERASLDVLGSLGEGGMGRVLLAKQRSLGREVAVKVLKVESNGALAQALLHEGRVLGLVEHPNVVPVYALGSDAHGQPALVMKRIDGVAWSELIRRPDHPFWAEVHTISANRIDAHVEILMHVAQAVHYAHERGVLHRDIKADNVIVGRYGEVYLADWGIAIRKEDRVPSDRPRVVGTPTHLAPEMARGDLTEIDERTDVYLLGATLHEVLTGGRGRHTGDRLVQMISAALTSAPPIFDETVPRRLAEVCERATRPERAERYPTALAFRAALADTLRYAGSIALTEATNERHAELEAVVKKSDVSPESVYRLLSECRFGYAQALREWPENEDAKHRLAASIEAVARFEIASSRAGAARALISELEDPPADLRAALEALEARARRDEERKLELERIARDVDPTRSAAQYAWFFGGLGVIVVGISVYVGAYVLSGAAYGPANLAVSAGFILTAFVVGAIVWRRALLDRQASRGVMGLLLGAFSGAFLDRLVALLDGTTAPQIAGSNAAIGTSFCIGAALLVRPWFAWLTIPFIASAVIGALYPGIAVVSFSASAAIVLVGAAAFWWRDRQRERGSAEP